MKKTILGILIGVCIPLAYVGAKDALQKKSPSTVGIEMQNQIRETLRHELTHNPEIIVEALEGLRQKQEASMREAASAAAAPYKTDLMNAQTAIQVGNGHTPSKKTLVTFLDPNCQHCRHFGVMLRELFSESSDTSLLLRYWPILGKASEEASQRLIQYKDHPDLHKLLTKMETFPQVVNAQVMDTFIKELALSKHPSVLSNENAQSIITATNAIAQKIGLNATPTSFLITEDSVQMVRPGNLEELRALLLDDQDDKATS